MERTATPATDDLLYIAARMVRGKNFLILLFCLWCGVLYKLAPHFNLKCAVNTYTIVDGNFLFNHNHNQLMNEYVLN